MNDHELETTLRSVHTDPTRYADAESVVRDVMSYPFHQTPQQRRWLPRRTVRFGSMFSATKFVVAGAIVALFGGYLLVAQPFDQQEASVPGAATDGAASAEGAAYVTGQRLDSHYSQAPALGPGAVDTGRFEMSDERLSGDVTFIIDAEIFESGPGDEQFLYWGTMVIENDRGSWEGTHFAAEHYARPDVQPGPIVMQLVGSGDYEGLSAILYETVVPDPAHPTGGSVDGMIFPGDLPPDRKPPDRE